MKARAQLIKEAFFCKTCMCQLHTCLPELRLDTALRKKPANALGHFTLKYQQDYGLSSVLRSGLKKTQYKTRACAPVFYPQATFNTSMGCCLSMLEKHNPESTKRGHLVFTLGLREQQSRAAARLQCHLQSLLQLEKGRENIAQAPPAPTPSPD